MTGTCGVCGLPDREIADVYLPVDFRGYVAGDNRQLCLSCMKRLVDETASKTTVVCDDCSEEFEPSRSGAVLCDNHSGSASDRCGG